MVEGQGGQDKTSGDGRGKGVEKPAGGWKGGPVKAALE